VVSACDGRGTAASRGGSPEQPFGRGDDAGDSVRHHHQRGNHARIGLPDRGSFSQNFEALEFARSLGVNVAINIIADPACDRERFRVVREWCLEIPEIANISANTPYPGRETWATESRKLVTRDYRLFDIQHAVLPTHLPLPEFYAELVQTQRVLNTKHLGAKRLWGTAKNVVRLLARGQTNFLKMLFKFNSVYNPALQLADHARPVRYQVSPPPPRAKVDPRAFYVHKRRWRPGGSVSV
jgi:hypothetical protein